MFSGLKLYMSNNKLLSLLLLLVYMWLHGLMPCLVRLPMGIFQPILAPGNIARRCRRWLSIRNTYSNHLSWWRFATSSINFPSLLSTLFLTQVLITLWPQNTWAVLCRHLWSNTNKFINILYSWCPFSTPIK